MDDMGRRQGSTSRTLVILLGLLALASVVTAAVLLLNRSGSSSARPGAGVPSSASTGPSTSPTGVGATSPSSTDLPTSANTVGRPFPGGNKGTFEGALLQLPLGYRLDADDHGQACLDLGRGEQCGAQLLRSERMARTEGAFEPPDADSQTGWYQGTDVPGCGGGEVRASTRTERATRPFGAKRADYARWRVVCADESVQMWSLWALPTSGLDLLLEERPPDLSRELLQDILGRVDLSGLERA